VRADTHGQSERVTGTWSLPARDAGVDLVVLVNGFPRLSETFVLQELLHLEERGLRLLVVALSNPHEVVRQEDLARLRARVEYLPEPQLIGRRRMARAHAALLRARGKPYLAELVRLRRDPHCSRKARRRAVLLAQRIVSLGSPPMYVHFAHKPATIGRAAARLADVRYGLSCHAKDIWLTPTEELGPKLKDAEVVLTCTAAGRDELARHAGGRTPVVLAYHGVDVSRIPDRPAPTGEPRILTVGRLVEKKGHDTLIRAAAILRDRGVPFTLRIAGDGLEWPRLQRLVHSLSLGDRVIFLGPLTPAEVRAEYASASVFALACRTLANGDRDGLPNVVLEAMTHGLPVVSTRQSGIAEAVEHGSTGLVAEPEDPGALAAALECVLTDAGLAERLGTAARAAVRARFDRTRLLPDVSATLSEAGLIRLGGEALSLPTAGEPEARRAA
jgi:glycosyltransferase involved in cell wall biosynthesis